MHCIADIEGDDNTATVLRTHSETGPCTVLSPVMLNTCGIDVTSIPGTEAAIQAIQDTILYKYLYIVLVQYQVVEPVHGGQTRRTRQWAGTFEECS